MFRLEEVNRPVMASNVVVLNRTKGEKGWCSKSIRAEAFARRLIHRPGPEYSFAERRISWLALLGLGRQRYRRFVCVSVCWSGCFLLCSLVGLIVGFSCAHGMIE